MDEQGLSANGTLLQVYLPVEYSSILLKGKEGKGRREERREERREGGRKRERKEGRREGKQLGSSCRHYAEGNKQVIKGNTLYGSICMKL